MTHRRGIVTALLVALSVTAPLTVCDTAEEPDEEVAEDPTATDLGELGGRIYLEPERAEAILADADLDRESFAVRVREISADPEQAREYAEAFERVAGDEPSASTGATGPEPAAEPADDGAGGGVDTEGA